MIQLGALTLQATVVFNGAAGTLTLTVTDSAANTDTATVAIATSGVTSSKAPSSAGTAATACPTPLTFAPISPAVSETFSPTSVGENVASTLTIIFTNANGFDLTQSHFAETVPAKLVIATSPAPTTTCTGTSGTLNTSASSVTMVGAIIPAKGSCTITVSVESATPGAYTNTIAVNALSTAPAGGNSVSAAASLTVSAPASSGGGGGALDGWDMMLGVGALLAVRRHVGRPKR